jgi:aubergine-like protein
MLCLDYRIPVTANYVRLNLEAGKGVYEYEVRFEPQLDSRKMQNQLLTEHVKDLGQAKTFDGVTLYLPIKLQQEVRCNLSDSFPSQVS